MTYIKGMVEIGLDFRTGEDVDVVQLPHSCDNWIIGGPTEIDVLIEDLKEIREEFIKLQSTKEVM